MTRFKITVSKLNRAPSLTCQDAALGCQDAALGGEGGSLTCQVDSPTGRSALSCQTDGTSARPASSDGAGNRETALSPLTDR